MLYNGYDPFPAYNTVCNIIVLPVSLYRLYFTVSHGQMIEDGVEDVVKALRHVLVRYSRDLDQEQRDRVTMLKENFEHTRGISPRKVFNLNLSMMLSSLSTLMTYLIILMQFKAGDG